VDEDGQGEIKEKKLLILLKPVAFYTPIASA